jgi:hypothetical protein
MNLNEKNITSLFLWGLILVGAAMRFYHLGDWSLTNDELSALNRTQHDSNLALWLSYAKVPDTHPPLVQFFIYNWTNWFGNDPLTLRLPFAILGIICIPLSYRLFNLWFSRTTGVFVAAGIALLNFPIVYTQLARPYGMGLFIGLLFTYYWSKLILSGRYTLKTYLLYVIIGGLSLYVHYFLTLSIVITILTGFFLIKKHRVKTYLILNSFIGLAFLPYLPYFLLQLKVGGVGGWLPPPENSFFLSFLYYGLNSSWLVILTILTLILYGIRTKLKFSYRNWILLLWSLLPFLIGFLYSKYVNPVIQYSTLLFSFPFLLAFVGAMLERVELRSSIKSGLIIFGAILVFTSAINWRYYHESSFGEFKETTKTLAKWTNEIDHSYAVIGNMVDPFYYNYYLNKMNWEDEFKFTAINTTSDVSEVYRFLKHSQKEKIIFTWSNTNNPFELKELLLHYYPKIEKSKRLNNAEVILFGRENNRQEIFNYHTTFNVKPNELGYQISQIRIDSLSKNYYYQVDSTEEYPVVVKDILGKNLPLKNANVVTFSIHFKSVSAPEAIIALSIDNEEGNVNWRGTDLAPFYSEKEWNYALVSFYLPEGVSPTDKIKAYVWNRGKESFFVDDVSFYAYEDSQYYLK